MGRYDTAVKCGQIKSLIEDNQYLKAMEEIEGMDFEKIPSIADLYLFADIFLRAEKMDVAKDLYYTVYHRTASRPALYRLLMLMIRMGDIEEAKDLYLTYEIVAGVTLDTYELRYRLAKAEGEPGTKLIEILEQLKEDEYTEEWGLQLAKLYEMEGMREKCIEECEDLERWFGTGTVVEKARELKKRCMSPSWVKPTDVKIPEPEFPDPEEKIPAFAHGPVHVEEILPEKESVKIKDAEAETGQAEKVEEIPEETEEEGTTEPEEDSKYEEEDAYNVQEGVLDDKMTGEETVGKEKSKPGLFHRIVDYFRVDLDQFDEEREQFPEELDTYKQQSTAEINVKAILAEGVDDILEEAVVPPATKVVEEAVSVPMEETVSTSENEAMEETVSASEVETLEVGPSGHTETQSLEKELQEMQENRKVINLEDTMNLEEVQIKSHPLGNSSSAENYEDISRNGLAYGTLKGTILKLQNYDGIINFALTEGTEGMSLVVAKRLFKELKKINYFEAKNMLKIMADKLAEVDLEERVLEFIGGCVYIMDAPSLSSESVENLNRLMEKYSGQFVIMLEGSYDEMDSFLSFYKEFEKKITFKVKL